MSDDANGNKRPRDECEPTAAVEGGSEPIVRKKHRAHKTAQQRRESKIIRDKAERIANAIDDDEDDEDIILEVDADGGLLVTPFDVEGVNNTHIDFAAAATAPMMGDFAAREEQVRLFFPYRANFNDHFETSEEALKDLMPVIEAMRSLVRPNCPESFTLYDPYYCNGAVKGHWEALGVPKVIHEKRDFYHDVEEGTVPSHFDMLVTNPPYSDDHIQRLMEFLIGSNKPWAFLVPDYVATKDWYKELIKSCFEENLVSYRGQNIFCGAAQAPAPVAPPVASFHNHNRPMPPSLQQSRNAAAKAIPRMPLPGGAPLPAARPLPPQITSAAAALLQAVQSSSSASAVAPTSSASAPAVVARHVVGIEPFYIVPRVWYDFKHPLGAGHEKSHFKSMWFVWCGRRTNDVLRAVTCDLAAKSGGGGGMAINSNKPSTAQQQVPTVVTGLAGLREAQHVKNELRKNPHQRAKERR